MSVELRRFSGARLADYRQFIRVLPRRQGLRIGIRDGISFQRGEAVAARIENRGTTEAYLPNGSGLTLERLDGEVWAKVKADEPPSVMFEDPEFLPGGCASQCSFFPIPADAEPGEYRFSAVVETGRGKSRSIYRQFAVSQ